ncbi:NACHT C-terminal helical domain 2-containing protein [Leptolyngbya sp. AN02str]|uniref:NACHT C-terminal helical domain 2-containing protein n=1 Tax=Leptolyngbya sp. AN02str TaxID=3423363 RepID=UPI003D320048
MQFRLPRSLRLTDSGLISAQRALRQYHDDNRTELAHHANVERTTVFRFFNQKNLTFNKFENICRALDLQWEEVGEPSNNHASSGHSTSARQTKGQLTTLGDESSIEELVRLSRTCVRDRIIHDCASIQLFSLNIRTDSLYVPTQLVPVQQADIDRIADELTLKGQQDIHNFNRLGHPSGQRIPSELAAERFNRLFLYSKPGSGKTTYLQWLAVQCSEGKLLPGFVPVFISFKDYAALGRRLTLQSFIERYFETCQLPNHAEAVTTLLSEGRILLLLDGLDEVQDAEWTWVLAQLRALVAHYHKCRFVLSCRPPLRIHLPGFEMVTLATFDIHQIQKFARKWFMMAEGSDRSAQFMERLRRHVAIGELATTPLLLTMLCRVFDADGDFPNSRSALYRRGFDLLLGEWDVYRTVERDTPYQQLTVKVKAVLLSVIASTFFKRGLTLFPRRDVEAVIEDFFQHRLNKDPMEIDATAILQSIERQHGLMVSRASNYYSFSHLTFQEYLTAVSLVSQRECPIIYDHVADERWRYVIEVVAELLPEGVVDDFLLNLKKRLDQTLARSPTSQQFVQWLDQYTQSSEDQVRPEQLYQTTMLRAWYFVSSLEHVGYISSLGRRSQRQLEFPDFDIATSAISSHWLDIHSQFYRMLHARVSQHDLFFSAMRNAKEALRMVENLRLRNALDEWQFQIEQQLPHHRDQADWWSARHQDWKQRVRQLMQHYFHLKCDWGFTDEDRILLRRYYDATKLLAECINRSPRLSRESFHRIASNLLRIES